MDVAVSLFELRSRCRNRGQSLPAMALTAAVSSLLLQRLKCCNAGQWPAASLLIVDLFIPQLHNVRLVKADQGALVRPGTAVAVSGMPRTAS